MFLETGCFWIESKTQWWSPFWSIRGFFLLYGISTISLVLVAHLFSQASQASLHPKLLEKIEEAEGMFAWTHFHSIIWKKCCSYKEGCQTKSKWTILSKYVTDWNAVAVIQRNWLSRFQFLLNLYIPTTLEIKTRKDTGDRKIKTLDCYISS